MQYDIRGSRIHRMSVLDVSRSECPLEVGGKSSANVLACQEGKNSNELGTFELKGHGLNLQGAFFFRRTRWGEYT